MVALVLSLPLLVPAEACANGASPCVQEGMSWRKWSVKFTASKLGLNGSGKVWAAMPSSSDMQNVHSIAFSSSPNSTYTESVHGNSIAYWRTRFIRSSSFSQSVEVSLLEAHWDIDSSRIGEYDPTNPEIEQYLQASSLLQADHPELQQAAKEIIGNETDPYQKAQLILNFVRRYGIHSQGEPNPDALDVLRTKRGSCEAYAFLFAGLARAAEIPARVVAGLAFLTLGEFPFFGGRDGESSWHLWNEIYLPDCGWILVDATRGIIGELGGDRIAFSKGSEIPLGQGGPTVPWLHLPVAQLDTKRRQHAQLAGDYFQIVVSPLDS